MPQVTREVVWVSFSFFREFHFFQEAVLPRMASFFCNFRFTIYDFGCNRPDTNYKRAICIYCVTK